MRDHQTLLGAIDGPTDVGAVAAIHPSVSEEKPVSRRSRTVAETLVRDPVFITAAAIMALVALPYVLPIMAPDQLQNWGWNYAKLPVSIATLIVVVFGVKEVRTKDEKDFWHWIAAGYGSMVAIRLVETFLPASVWSLPVRVLDMGAYLLFYAALLVALNASRRTNVGDQDQLLKLHTAGLLILVATAITYWEIIPWVVLQGAAWPWYPTLFLYACLDLLLCMAFLRGADQAENHRWRSILIGMAVVCGLYAIVDIADAIFLVDGVEPPELSRFWDLLWFAGDAVLIGVARTHIAEPDRDVAPRQGGRVHSPSTVALVIGLFLVPASHVSLHYQEVLHPGLRAPREAVVLGFLGAMGFIVLTYFRILERANAWKARKVELRVERIQREALLDVLASERQLRERQRYFLAEAGHEIRTPLTVLRGDFEVALLRARSAEEYRMVLERAVNDIKSVTTMANALIHVAQTDETPESSERNVIDLVAFVPGVVERFQTASDSAGISVDVQVSPNLSVQSDAALLARALGNLVDNGIKYAADGGSLRVSAEADQEGRIHLTVADRGAGMSARDQARCFDRFYRGDVRPGVPGTGLGLPICSAIMSRLAGGVEVRARDGGGLAFALWLPADPA